MEIVNAIEGNVGVQKKVESHLAPLGKKAYPLGSLWVNFDLTDQENEGLLHSQDNIMFT